MTENILKLLFLGMLIHFMACDGKDEPIPAYIYLTEASLETEYQTQGTDDHEITDVWLYVDDQLLGVLDIPVAVPVLTDGPTSVKMQAGILNNGDSDSRSAYSLYTWYTTEIDLSPTQIDTIQPQFEYSENVNFVFLNDFENSNNFEDKLALYNNFGVTSGSSLVFEGSRSGRVQLSTEEPIFDIGTISTFSIPEPSTGLNSYLEFNYKSDIEFQLYIAGSQTTPDGNFFFTDVVLFVFDSDEWNKLYFDLTEYATERPNIDFYQVGFRGVLPSEQSEATFLIDNIKVLHNN